MNAKQLLDQLQLIVADGHGERPVKLMIIEDGVTYAQDLTRIFASQPHDGEVVWILVDDEIRPPAWASNSVCRKIAGMPDR